MVFFQGQKIFQIEDIKVFFSSSPVGLPKFGVVNLIRIVLLQSKGNGKASIDFVGFTIWSFNIAMENHHFQQVNPGKPSISMGQLYHGELLNCYV